MKNATKTLAINNKLFAVCTEPDTCRAALSRYFDAPSGRHVADCYKHPSASKRAAEHAITQRIVYNTISHIGYTVLSWNCHQFTAGYMLEGIDPEKSEYRTVLCIETARNCYHYDVTDII